MKEIINLMHFKHKNHTFVRFLPNKWIPINKKGVSKKITI